MLLVTYHALNYAGIIGLGLLEVTYYVWSIFPNFSLLAMPKLCSRIQRKIAPLFTIYSYIATEKQQ